jgi:uncharacterized protein (TIGR04255 family)
LGEYSQWPEFFDEARRVWGALRDLYRPAYAQAISVRFINELTIGVGESLDKYLKFYINVPDGVPQGFKNYFARIELFHSRDTIAILQSGLLSAQQSGAQLLLDIELVKNLETTKEEELWNAINELREPKNQIFFSCITEEWEAKLR